jgi:response regulator RpfG family c-di-GMP phosphodiesterase
MVEGKKRTILCVDDEPDVVGALNDALMKHFNVKTATSGKEALEIFRGEDIDLIISDQRMPEMEGTELLTQINQIKPICKKILLTGYADVNAAIDAINLGSVDKYFSKPWKKEELIETIETLMEEHETDEFLQSALEERKAMGEGLSTYKESFEQYRKFFSSYLDGVCITKDNKVCFVNKNGLSLLKCKNISEISGKDIKDIFPISEINRDKLIQKYMKMDSSPNQFDVKLCDGTSAGMKVNVNFASGEEGLQVCGIIFRLS